MKVTPGRSNFPVMVAASRYPEKKRSGQVRKTCSPVRSLYAFRVSFFINNSATIEREKTHAVGKGLAPL
jgi:hypothetical protein